MTFFKQCDLCGSLGHKAKDCALNRLEAQRDPVGELQRRQAYRERARADAAKRQRNELNCGSPQSSRGFGM